jgi:hypothetical protein
MAVPPYDLEWASSFPVSIADKNAGAFRANSYLSDSFDELSFHAAGLGIFIDTNSSMDVRFSADAQFDWNWSDVGGVDENSAAATEGGLASLFMRAGTSSPGTTRCFGRISNLGSTMLRATIPLF